MKKLLALCILSLLIFTACSKKNGEQIAETTTEIDTTSTVVSTEAVTTTEAETTTENAEPTVPMEEIKLEEMTLRYDTAVWETLDEYIKRMDESGEPLDDDTINELKSMASVCLVVRDSDASLLWIDTFPYDGIEGFGTKEDYELFGMAIEYLQQQSSEDVAPFKSEITERNGIMFIESSTGSDDTYVKTFSILKDNIQYSFFISNTSRSTAKKLMNMLIDNISFE